MKKQVSFRKRNIVFRGRATGQQVNDVYLGHELHTPAVGNNILYRVMNAVAAHNDAVVIGTER